MAKIKLLVKTEKNINELKRKEIQSIDWSTFPFSEQMQFVDVDVYNKLTTEGRFNINSRLKNYTERSVEFWNAVSGYNDITLAETLWQNATLETKGIMLENHAEWFNPISDSYRILTGNGDYITSFIKKHGRDFQNEKDGYVFLTDPRISFDEFNAPFNNYPTLLHYIYEVLEDAYEHDEYPVLVHNHMLKAAGYPHIKNLSPEFLKDEDACSVGRTLAKKWIRIVTNGEKDFITWDEAVDYIRANPTAYNDTEMINHLDWWWTHSIQY